MLTKNHALSLEQKLEIQRGRIQRMECTVIGLLSRIILDAAEGSKCPEIERLTIGRRIDFMSQNFPLALSEDHAELLLPAGLPRHLQDIPDPRWPGATFVGEKTPWIPHRWEDRATGITTVAGREYMVFSPVETIEAINLGYFAKCSWPKLHCMADSNGESMALLLDIGNPRLMNLKGRNVEVVDAHLVGGRFMPDTRVRVNRQAMEAAFRM